MTNISRKIFIGSLTSLTVMATQVAFAEEMVTAPTFEGGVTASIGTFYAVPSVNNNQFVAVHHDEEFEQIDIKNANSDYDWGWDASLGYLFEETANGIELSYRGFSSDNESDVEFGAVPDGEELADIEDRISYELNSLDLMISQYMDLGDHMQMRFNAGLAYVELEQENQFSAIGFDGEQQEFFVDGKQTSKFNGLGPRVGIDARYDFGGEIEGFGIVGGASAAYFLGETDLTSHASFSEDDGDVVDAVSISEDMENHAVTNLRANVGIDYVYFFDNEGRSTLGLELGYLVDFYDNAVSNFSELEDFHDDAAFIQTDTGPITFSGPYLSLKGAF